MKEKSIKIILIINTIAIVAIIAVQAIFLYAYNRQMEILSIETSNTDAKIEAMARKLNIIQDPNTKAYIDHDYSE